VGHGFGLLTGLVFAVPEQHYAHYGQGRQWNAKLAGMASPHLAMLQGVLQTVARSGPHGTPSEDNTSHYRPQGNCI